MQTGCNPTAAYFSYPPSRNMQPRDSGRRPVKFPLRRFTRRAHRIRHARARLIPRSDPTTYRDFYLGHEGKETGNSL
jgi:hypothetical protein